MVSITMVVGKSNVRDTNTLTNADGRSPGLPNLYAPIGRPRAMVMLLSDLLLQSS